MELTQRTPREAGADRIVVGYDGSPYAGCALDWALGEARFRQVGVHVVSCWLYPGWIEPFPYQPPMSGEELEASARKHLAEAMDARSALVTSESRPLDVTAQVLEGAPAVRLLEFGDTATMIVVGCRGRGGFAGLLLGSVSQHLGEHARCPVVIVHGESEADRSV